MANQKIKFNGTNGNGETATVEIDVVNGAALMLSLDPKASSLFETITTATAPASGAATYALDSDTLSVEFTNMSATAGQYCLVGFGTSIVDAETNRDAGQVFVPIGVIKMSETKPALATYFSIKSAAGTPIVHYSQRA